MKTDIENPQQQNFYLITVYEYDTISTNFQKNYFTSVLTAPNTYTNNRILNIGYDYQYQSAFIELDSAEIIFLDMPIQEYNNLFSNLSENIL